MSDFEDREMIRRIIAKFDDDAVAQMDVERWLERKMDDLNDNMVLHEIVRDSIDDALHDLAGEIARSVGRTLDSKRKAMKDEKPLTTKSQT